MRSVLKGFAVVSSLMMCAAVCIAQPASSTSTQGGIARRSDAEIVTQSKTLMEEAKKSPAGIASVTLEKYPGHFTMLTVRTKSGGAEMHANYNDIFIVLDGEATEMTGGTMVGGKLDAATGESRGSSVEGATPTPMRKGDVIHIAPNIPHQTVLAPGKTFTYYVIKVAAPNIPTSN